jgi:hypothetical protein
MKIKSRKIYGRNLFDEVTNPTKLFEFQDHNLIAIYHSYYGQWPGRHLDVQKQCLSIYSIEPLELVAHIDALEHQVNDVDYHCEKNLLLIGTGAHDGGYFFNGKLLLFNLSNKKLTNIVEDNREFTKCRFAEHQIEFIVSPENDVDMDNCSDYWYQIPIEESKVYKIEDLSPNRKVSNDEHIFNFDSFQENLIKLHYKLSDYCNQINKRYEPKYLAWDLAFIDDNSLIVGYSEGKIGILNILEDHFEIRKISEKGDCVQIFKNNHSDTIIVNISNLSYDTKSHNIALEYDILTGKTTPVFEGAFILTKTINDEYLARYTDHRKKSGGDILFTASFKHMVGRWLGHYDLFNHYLRIDNCNNLYVLVGNPKEQHKNKRLVEINPKTFNETILFDIEKQPNHYNNLNGILINETFIIEGTVYNPNPQQKSYELTGVHKNGNILWKKELTIKSTGMAKIEDCQNKIAISMVSGALLIVCSLTGDTITFPKNEAIYGAPISISNKGNKLAIGYDNGLIEIIEIE